MPKMLRRQPLMQRAPLARLPVWPAVPLRLPIPVLARLHRVQRRLKLPSRAQRRRQKRRLQQKRVQKTP